MQELFELCEDWAAAMSQGDSATANSVYHRMQNCFHGLACDGKTEQLFEGIDERSDPIKFFLASHLKAVDKQPAIDIYSGLTKSPFPFIAVSAEYIAKELKI